MRSMGRRARKLQGVTMKKTIRLTAAQALICYIMA
jgi:hypothetical protein